jgi:hypothetical protein
LAWLQVGQRRVGLFFSGGAPSAAGLMTVSRAFG